MTEYVSRDSALTASRLGSLTAITATLVVLIIGAVLVGTLDDGVPWGGDEALYVMHARNIAQGKPYSPTPFIANPANAINPQAYPPGLPMILAPVYYFSGLDWLAFKVVVVVSFVFFLLVFSVLAREWLPPTFVIPAIAFMGLHPYVWRLKETVPTEFPFLLFTYAGVLLIDRALRPEGNRRAWVWIVAALCVACAYLTRSVGIVLIPAFALAGFWQTRRIINPGTLAAGVGFLLAWLVEQVYKPDLGTYVNYMDGFYSGTIWNNIQSFEISFRYFLQDKGYPPTLEHTLLAIVAVLATIGFIVRARSRVGAFEFLLLGYGGLLLIYPVNLEPDRYSFPLWPIMILYALLGCAWLGRWLPNKFSHSLGVALLAVLALNFVVSYRATAEMPAPRSAADPNSERLYGYIRANLPVSEVIITRKPTVIALLTDRHASIWPENFTDAQFVDYMRKVDARYVLFDIDHLMQYIEEEDPLEAFIRRNQSSLQLVYSNESFMLYRMDR